MVDSATQKSLTVGDAALQLSVPAHTIRRWTEYHAMHLSADAHPENKGQARRLTPRDIQVLTTVKQLREQGLTVPRINERLQDIAIGEVDTESPQDEQEGHHNDLAQIMTGNAIAQHTGHDSALHVRVMALEDSIRAIETQRPTWRDVFVIGVGLFIAGLIVGLAVWWF